MRLFLVDIPLQGIKCKILIHALLAEPYRFEGIIN